MAGSIDLGFGAKDIGIINSPVPVIRPFMAPNVL